MNKIKQQICNDVSKLDEEELYEIFNIIKTELSNDKITENNNGIFINLKFLKDETVQKIDSFIKRSLNNKIIIESQEQKKKKDFEIYKEIIESDTDDMSDEENQNSEDFEIIKLDSIKNNTSQVDKFTFQNYIDKLSINSNKNFENEIDNLELHNTEIKMNNEICKRILKNTKTIREHKEQMSVDELTKDI